MRSIRLWTLGLALAAMACGDGASGTPDAGTTIPDAGSVQTDAGGTPDAGSTPDAGETPDGGDTTPDAGETPDAGPQPTFGDDVIANGGFERWDGVLPDAWRGLQSNLAEESLEKIENEAFEGSSAARLVNASGTHKRFTTAPFSIPAGRYFCSIRVRGKGELRTARYDGDFSSYTAWETIDTGTWEERTFDFGVAENVDDVFELVFSVRNTRAPEHLLLDAVSCRRRDEPCDAVTCEEWASCDHRTVTCEPRFDRCGDDSDCREWESCNEAHRCELRPGRCNRTTECAQATPETPVCEGNTCVAGDPCAGVSCVAPRTCSTATATCALPEGACVTTADCLGALPACDTTTQRCVAADDAANVFPNGGFEAWDTYDVPYLGEHFLPDSWYGLDIPGSSEITPARVKQYTAHVHGGSSAVQLEESGVAERFTSEAFDVPAGRFTCSYRVRGHGNIRHRAYSTGGWSQLTDTLAVDSDAWIPVIFHVNGGVRDFRLILYPSYTMADRDHLQVDDVVCTRDP